MDSAPLRVIQREHVPIPDLFVTVECAHRIRARTVRSPLCAYSTVSVRYVGGRRIRGHDGRPLAPTLARAGGPSTNHSGPRGSSIPTWTCQIPAVAARLPPLTSPLPYRYGSYTCCSWIIPVDYALLGFPSFQELILCFWLLGPSASLATTVFGTLAERLPLVPVWTSSLSEAPATRPRRQPPFVVTKV